MSDPKTLESILDQLKTKQIQEKSPNQIVVIDAGIATKENLEMLKNEHFDYLCVSRQKLKDYTVLQENPILLKDKNNQ